MRFPPGEPIFSGKQASPDLCAEVDGLLAQGYCPTGWLDIETPDSRLTCLIHQGRPYLAGLTEPDGLSWVPLAELPTRVEQLEQASCSLLSGDLVQVLMMAVHFRNRPDLQAATNLVDLGHVLSTLAQEGHDAALALERSGKRTLMFLQKGIPARLYFADYRDDPGDGSVADRFLEYGFAPEAPVSRVEVFHRLRVEPDADAGLSFTELERQAQPPPPVDVEIRLGQKLVLQRMFMPPCMFIGRESNCELRLDNLNISRRHARICWTKGRFEIEDLGSSNGTLLNGRVVDRQQLMPQDEITIGKFSIRLRSPTATPTPQQTMMMQPSSDQADLYLVGDETSLPLVEELSLGKVAGVDLRLPGLFVKPIHARLKNTGEGSARLTCIGKARVQHKGKKTGQAVLRPDDSFRIGRHELRLVRVPRFEAPAG
jgi:hypothetical protein